MNLIPFRRGLTLTFWMLLAQIGAANWCSAAEAPKTDQKSDPEPQRPGEGRLPQALLSLSADTTAFSRYAFLVDKHCRTLTVWENQGHKVKLVDAFPADIGAQSGDKSSEGDSKTPEGIYFFQKTMDGRKLDFAKYGIRVFTMDYPNYFDRLEKKTGQGIWLHAVPDTTSLERGSRGCVVVRNRVIEDLSKYIELKLTPIVVVDEVNYLSEQEWQSRQQLFMDWLENWRSAWTSKNLERYMALYSSQFHSAHMNKAQWRRYKSNLNDRYKFIDVQLKNIQIFNQGAKMVVRFLQNYKSDLKEDFGAKILYALKSGDQYEIVGENWVPMRGQEDRFAPLGLEPPAAPPNSTTQR